MSKLVIGMVLLTASECGAQHWAGNVWRPYGGMRPVPQPRWVQPRGPVVRLEPGVVPVYPVGPRWNGPRDIYGVPLMPGRVVPVWPDE